MPTREYYLTGLNPNARSTARAVPGGNIGSSHFTLLYIIFCNLGIVKKLSPNFWHKWRHFSGCRGLLVTMVVATSSNFIFFCPKSGTVI